MNLKILRISICCLMLAFTSCIGQSKKNNGKDLLGNRFLTLNAIIRVNQIEVSRDKSIGRDERYLHTPSHVIKFREAVEKGFPESKITWAFSWLALHDTTANYKKIHELVVGYHKKFGDEITFIPGAYFSNAYNSIEQVNKDLHDGLQKVTELVGDNYRPLSIVAGLLSAKNLQYLAEMENIHVCQGNMWSVYAVDYQDGDGSVSYPYYPSKEHFCKPAQSKEDFIDCVNLDGWTMDFLSARREGFADGFNSRMGVGPIETLAKYGSEIGLKEMLHTTAIHYDMGFELNGFAWVTNCWEIALSKDNPEPSENIDPLDLTKWLAEIKMRWPDVRFITQGEFGHIWRQQYKSNNFDYRFEQKGSGIGGSDADKEIRWFMNKDFRLALIKDTTANAIEKVIDFTNYNLEAKEPISGTTRSWSFKGEINQKQTRSQDKPIPISTIPSRMNLNINKRYPDLLEE